MTRLGITQKVQNAILDSRFVNLFDVDTHYRVEDSMRIDLDILTQLLGRLKGMAERILAEKNEEGKT